MKSFRMTLIGIVGVALLAGCAEKLTYDNWKTVFDGQSSFGVEQTLGKKHRLIAGNEWHYVDADRGISAAIYFNEDGSEVIGKEWSDPNRAFEGSNPRMGQGAVSDETKVQQLK